MSTCYICNAEIKNPHLWFTDDGHTVSLCSDCYHDNITLKHKGLKPNIPTTN